MEALRLAEDDGVDAGALVVTVGTFAGAVVGTFAGAFVGAAVGAVVGGAAVVDRAKLILFFNASLLVSAARC